MQSVLIKTYCKSEHFSIQKIIFYSTYIILIFTVLLEVEWVYFQMPKSAIVKAGSVQTQILE